MKFPLLFSTAALLCACDSPSFGYIDAQRYDAQVHDWQFAIYRKEDSVQIIRLNTVWGADTQTMAKYAPLAVFEATGCTIQNDTISGDQVAITADIDCPAQNS